MPLKKRFLNITLIVAMAIVSLLMIASVVLEKDEIIDRTNSIIASSRANYALKQVLKDQTDSELDNGTVIKAKGRYFVYNDNALTVSQEFPDAIAATTLARVHGGKAVVFLFKSDADTVLNEATDKIRYEVLIDPEEGSFPLYEYSQVNKAAAKYLELVSYETTSDNVSYIANFLEEGKRYDLPAGCTIELEAGELTILDNGTQKIYRTTVEKGPYTFYNITPGVGGEFYVLNGDRIVQRGHLRPTGALRMIYSDTPGLQNMRDLGGWPCDGGTIKYNILFRGGMVIDATDTDRNTWVKMLGIQHDVFLKTYDEILFVGREQYRNKSPLGDHVFLYQCDLTAPNSENKQTLEQAKDEMNGIINRIFDNAIAGEPTYFHCLAGADRTGMVAVVLEGVLGVSKYDIDRDYELTSFNTLRERTNGAYYADIRILMMYPGKTFRDKCVEYLLDCGISLDKINAFRNAVIDGTPEDIKEKYLAVIPQGSNLCVPDGDGWIDGGRCSSTGADRFDTPAYTVTNYISVQNGDTVYVKNLHVSDMFYSGMYREDKSAISGFLLKDDKNEKYIKDIEINRDWEVFTINNEEASYIRLCGAMKFDKEDIIINIYRNGEWLVIDD